MSKIINDKLYWGRVEMLFVVKKRKCAKTLTSNED